MIQEAVKQLHLGHVVAHPTETCYGLAVDIFQKQAVQRLYTLKGMPYGKPVSILVRDLEEAQYYGVFSEKALALAQKYWPGPLTIVVPRAKGLPSHINPGLDTIGIRVSPNGKTKKLLEAFAGPITTTSANKFGEPSAYTVQEFLDQALVPDYILDSGRLGGAEPSTLISVIGDDVQVLRKGPIQLG